MKSARAVSPRVLALFGASFVLLGAALAAHRLRPPPRMDPTLLAPLRTEHASLAESSDATIAALRKEAAPHPAVAWTAAQADAWLKTNAADWTATTTPDEKEMRVRLVRPAPSLADWPSYLAALRAWEKTSGVFIDTFDVRADGRAPGRTFTRVAIGLRFARGATASLEQPQPPKK